MGPGYGKHPERLTDRDSPWVEARGTRPRIEGNKGRYSSPLNLTARGDVVRTDLATAAGPGTDL